MRDSEKDVEPCVEYLYKEYERLHGVANGYAHSSFDDFKLLGAIGAILAWQPLLGLFNKSSCSEADLPLLFAGFVAILLVTAIIGTRDLLKQSLIIFHRNEVQAYEPQLKAILCPQDSKAFTGYQAWGVWFTSRHRPVALAFYGLCAATIVLFPTATLHLVSQSDHTWALSYFVLACLVSAFPAWAMHKLYPPAPSRPATSSLPPSSATGT